jgi:predicted phosphodiesterase
MVTASARRPCYTAAVMRMALLSDIHGNPIALDAVLADITARGGVDSYLVLGDMVALGYDPVGVLDRLVALPDVRFVRGNTDRYLVTGDRPPPTPDDTLADPGLMPRLLELQATFAWTQGAITAAGWLDWFVNLPLEQRLQLPDGTRLLGVHGSPRRDNEGIEPSLTDAAVGAILAGCDADLICCGHTHRPLDRTVGGMRVVNPGSVSNPVTPDLRAGYAIIAADAGGYTIEHHRVSYDVAAVLEAVERMRNPGNPYILSLFRSVPW